MTIQRHPNTDCELTQSMHPSPAAPDTQSRALNGPVVVLAWTMFLVPAVGVPSELMLQDTLKSAVVAFGVLAAAMLFFWQQRHRTAPLHWHGLVWLPITLLLYALGSMVWSHTYLAGVEAIRWFLLSLLLWLGLNTLTKENLPTLLWGIHGGVVVASLWVALQFWFDLRWFPQGAPPSSTFINRNFFAEYAVSVLPLSIWLLVTMRPSRKLLWMAGSLALNVTAILMTGTRSALVALLVLLPILGFILIKYRAQWAVNQWTRTHRWSVGLILVLGIAGLGVIPTGHPDIATGTTPLGFGMTRTVSMAQGKEYTEGSFSIRSQMWKSTARMVLAQPWTGVGAGAWEVHIPLFQRDDTFAEIDYYAHNEYLQLLSEYGAVLGGLVLAILFAYLLKSMGSTWTLRGADLPDAPLRAFTLASLLALLIVSNAGFPWHLAACGALLVLCLATLAASDAQLGFSGGFFISPLSWYAWHPRLAIATLGIGLMVTGYITQQAAQVERKIMQAQMLAVNLARSSFNDPTAKEHQRAQLVHDMQEGGHINPHYRKLMGTLGDILAAGGDWENAVWAWESVAVSRPHVLGLWTYLAMGYAHLGLHERAHQALLQVQRLRPDRMETRTLEINLLSRAGHEDEAARLLNEYYDQGLYDYDRVMTGYALGYSTLNWPLAIRSLELRNKTWPEQAVDGYFRLGTLFANPLLNDDASAIKAFRSGFQLVPPDQKQNYLQQVPAKYRSQM